MRAVATFRQLVAICSISMLIAWQFGCGRTKFDLPGRDASPALSADADLIDASIDASIDAAGARPNYAFVTSDYYPGNLDGIDGANTKCNQEAQAAGLSGDFVALLQSPGQPDPSVNLQGSTGWALVTGQWIADSPQQVKDAQFTNALNVTAGGVRLTDSYDLLTWSGDSASHCNSWQNSDSGLSGATRSLARWGVSSILSPVPAATCAIPLRLACFERGRTATRQRRDIDHPLLFISSPWNIETTLGRASADLLCGEEAAQAGWPGTFFALLPDYSQRALSRVPNGLTTIFQRTDGELLGTLVAPTTFMMLDANMQQVDDYVWTGANVNAIPSGTDSCASWRDRFPAAMIGTSGVVGTEIYNAGFRPCALASRVYCVQR